MKGPVSMMTKKQQINSQFHKFDITSYIHSESANNANNDEVNHFDRCAGSALLIFIDFSGTWTEKVLPENVSCV